MYSPYTSLHPNFIPIITSSKYTSVTHLTPPLTTKAARCIVEFGTNYPGNDLSSQGDVATAYECCTLCNTTEKCVAWSYFISFKYCFLKGTAPTANKKQSYDGIWSGLLVNA